MWSNKQCRDAMFNFAESAAIDVATVAGAGAAVRGVKIASRLNRTIALAHGATSVTQSSIRRYGRTVSRQDFNSRLAGGGLSSMISSTIGGVATRSHELDFSEAAGDIVRTLPFVGSLFLFGDAVGACTQ